MKRVLLLAGIFCLFTASVFAQDYKQSAGVVAGSLNGLSYKAFITENLAIQADLAFGMLSTTGTGMYSYQIKSKENGTASGSTYKQKINTSLWNFQLAPNCVYQKNFVEKDWCTIAAVMGGGVSIGYAKASADPKVLSEEIISYDSDGDIYKDKQVFEEEADKDGLYSDFGKFGINAMLGLEVVLKNAPITLGFDFRPGYGLMFTGHDEDYEMRKKQYENWGREYSESVLTYHFFDWSIAASIRYTF